MKQRLYINTFLALIVALLLALALVFTSCGSVKKTTTSRQEIHDSTHLAQKDSTRVTDSLMIAVHTDSSQYKKTISIEIDTSYNGSDYPTMSEDYDTVKPVKPTRKGNTLVIDAWKPGPVKIDLGDFRPLRIDISESGSAYTHDSTAVTLRDSTRLQVTDSTSTTSQVTEKTTSKKKTGILFIIKAAVITAGLIWLILWLKRRKRK